MFSAREVTVNHSFKMQQNNSFHRYIINNLYLTCPYVITNECIEDTKQKQNSLNLISTE